MLWEAVTRGWISAPDLYPTFPLSIVTRHRVLEFIELKKTCLFCLLYCCMVHTRGVLDANCCHYLPSGPFSFSSWFPECKTQLESMSKSSFGDNAALSGVRIFFFLNVFLTCPIYDKLVFGWRILVVTFLILLFILEYPRLHSMASYWLLSVKKRKIAEHVSRLFVWYPPSESPNEPNNEANSQLLSFMLNSTGALEDVLLPWRLLSLLALI